jgi:serine/threonine-protein kinase HipA
MARAHMTALEIDRLLDAVIFNLAVGNVVSHAKNYSILLSPKRFGLAPLYDPMSGLDWANITQNHAQQIGSQQRGRYIYGRHWRRMAKACGLSRPGVIRRIDALITRLLAELPATEVAVASMPAGAGEMLATFAAWICERARLVQANAKRENNEADTSAAEPIDEGRTFGDV